MDRAEKNARSANLISLLFCLIAIWINFIAIVTFLVAVLAIVQVIHIVFGDITKSYRLLRKKQFLRIYAFALILFILSYLAVFVVNLKGRIYFSAILIAFVADFIANKIRAGKVRRINKKIKKLKFVKLISLPALYQ
jgi:hypothetical protein